MTFGIFQVYDDISHQRGVFCNRSLNLRSIKAIGYDMDYTLVHYHVNAWEGRAYEHIKLRLLQEGWPVQNLTFEPDHAMRGLVIDLKLGNIVKANRFGYVWRASHGMSLIPYSDMRNAYTRTLVDLSETERWVFLNTFFSISAAVMYAQLVDLLDRGQLPEVLGYGDLYWRVQDVLDAAHIEGELKAEIMAMPEEYVDRDPKMPLTLRDQKQAGKKLLLITNSEFEYTNFMLRYTVDPFLPDGETWRDLFDVAVVSARKPDFFTSRSLPILEVVDEDGLLRPWVGAMQEGHVYFGGHARALEECLGMSGDEILYVGDHVFADVNVTKNLLRWRTALVMREMEAEFAAITASRENQREIRALMVTKVSLEERFSRARLALLRIENDAPPVDERTVEELEAEITRVRQELRTLDESLAPLVMIDGTNFNHIWGYLMRAGNDKSHLTRQIERYADIYTSRVSNLLRFTPFMFYRSQRGSIPHDPDSAG